MLCKEVELMEMFTLHVPEQCSATFQNKFGFYAEGPSTTLPVSRLRRRRSHHNFRLHMAIKTRRRLVLTEADPVVANAEQSTVQTVK